MRAQVVYGALIASQLAKEMDAMQNDSYPIGTVLFTVAVVLGGLFCYFTGVI